MTSEDQARLIAERIAKRLSGESTSAAPYQKQNTSGISAELSAMHASLDNLKQKLVQLESRLSNEGSGSPSYSNRTDTQDRMTWAGSSSGKGNKSPSQFASTYAPSAHPSQERFGVEEATVSELVDFFEGEKNCELEPGGKPCDHCAICSSRGF